MHFARQILGWLVSVAAALWVLWFWAFAPFNYRYDGATDPSWSHAEFTRHVFRVRLVPMSRFGEDQQSVEVWSICECAARSGLLLVISITAGWCVFAFQSRRANAKRA